jgi:hypothetical protein
VLVMTHLLELIVGLASKRSSIRFEKSKGSMENKCK